MGSNGGGVGGWGWGGTGGLSCLYFVNSAIITSHNKLIKM